jgi:NDP-sugar pyrophosphorylase family protein
MIGFILAAGFGTRLLPLTEHVPKALMPVCGVPLVKRVHDYFRANGLDRIALNSHHHPRQVARFVRSDLPEVTLFHEQDAIRGTGGALVFARDYLGSDEAFCVANVDIITNADLKGLGREFLKRQCGAGLVTAPSRNGTILYDSATNGYVRTRSSTTGESNGTVAENLKSADFIGIAFYRKEFLSILSDDDFSIIPVWSRAREKGMAVTVLETGPVYWNDVGSPRALAQVHFDVLDCCINLPVPATQCVDTKEKKAYPASFGEDQKQRVGRYAWIDAMDIPRETTFSNAIVFADAVVPGGVRIENAIVTRHGVISIGT